MTLNARFGELLKEGIGSVSLRQGRTEQAVEREIAEKLGYSLHNIERWKYRNRVPREPKHVAFLVSYCVTYGRLDRVWARNILNAAHYDGAENLLEELFGPSSQHAEKLPIYPNLPPHYGGFLGRSADVERVLHGLASRWPIVSIEGMGGVGKTTLALEVARSCLPGIGCKIDPPFETVVWLSASSRPDQKQWFDEVLDTIARVLNHRNVTQLPPEEKRFEVNKLLHIYRVLLIIDNFETIEDPDLEHWLLEEVPEPSKVLITSRHTQLHRAWDRHLKGLEDPEALELIRRHAQRLDLQGTEAANQELLLPLVKVTQGNPMAIEMALGHVKYGGLSLSSVVDYLYIAHQTVNNVFSCLFPYSWEMLAEPARHVLLVIPFFGETASKEALRATTDLTIYELDSALHQLVEMSLLDAKNEFRDGSERYSAHPLTRAFVSNQLSMATEWEHAARQRWVAWYVRFLSQYDSSNQDWSVFAVFDEERENILPAIEWTLANQHSGMLIIIQRFWYYLFMHGYWQECEKYAIQALDRASSEGNTSARLWLTSHLGWLMSNREGTEQEAMLRLHSVEDEILALQRPELFEETNVLNYLGQAYRTLGDLDRAEAYQVRSLQLFQQVGNQQRALVSRYYLALIQFDRGQVEEAQQNYRDVLAEAQHIGYERAYCYCAYHLARALIGLNQFVEAEHWLKVTSELANHWDEPLLQAYVLFGRASLLRKQKQLIEAHNLALAALDAYRRLGSRDQHEAVELVAQLEEEMA